MEFTLLNGKKYKRCCGNCKYYNNGVMELGCSNCICQDKHNEYSSHGRPMKNYFACDEACKYYEFEPREEYTSKRYTQAIIREIYVTTEDGKMLTQAQSLRSKCNHKDYEGGFDNLYADKESKSLVCKICGARFTMIMPSKLKSKKDTNVLDVLQNLKIITPISNKELYNQIVKILIEYYGGGNKELCIEDSLIDDCIEASKKQAAADAKILAEAINLSKTESPEKEDKVSSPEKKPCEEYEKPEFLYYKGSTDDGGRVLIKERTNWDGNRTRRFGLEKVYSRYQFLYFSSGSYKYFDDLEEAKLVTNLHSISKTEYDMLSEIIFLTTEIYMHNLTGGFPREDSVKDYVKRIERKSRNLMEEYFN